MDMTNNSARAPEAVWSWTNGSTRTQCNNLWGSGGGNSTIYPRPDWQKAPGVDNQYSKHTRQIPDISAAASPDDTSMYYQGQWVPGGGTSAATPIWATGLMLVSQGLLQQTQQFAFGPSLFYAVAADKADQPYYDVTQGDNLYYKATPGWDYATGLGTPNIPGFYKALLALLKQSS
jgi:kumamolisin